MNQVQVSENIVEQLVSLAQSLVERPSSEAARCIFYLLVLTEVFATKNSLFDIEDFDSRLWTLLDEWRTH